MLYYFQCSKEEHDEIPIIFDTQKTELKILDDTITGFNIGMNIGEDAGQTIFIVYSYHSKKAR